MGDGDETAVLDHRTEFLIDDRPLAEILTTVGDLCARALLDLPDGYVQVRVEALNRPLSCLAKRDGDIVGFKFAYATEALTLFSWLGGVLPSARRSGIARGLMGCQHAAARAAGFSRIETHTRTDNKAMLMANLQGGYEVVGCEMDGFGRFILKQRVLL